MRRQTDRYTSKLVSISTANFAGTYEPQRSTPISEILYKDAPGIVTFLGAEAATSEEPRKAQSRRSGL